MTNRDFYKTEAALNEAFTDYCSSRPNCEDKHGRKCPFFSGINCRGQFANLEHQEPQPERTGIMTNQDLYPTVDKALDAFESLYPEPEDFVAWLKSPALPDWVKPGAKYRCTSTRLGVYEISRIDYAQKTVHSANGGYVTFNEVLTGAVEQYFELPKWVKPGARYLRKTYPARYWTVKTVDDENQLIRTRNTVANKGITSSFKAFMAEINDRVFLDLPDWVQIGTKFTCRLGCCKYEVTGFRKDEVLTKDGPRKWSDFIGKSAYKPEPEKQDRPDWLKTGACYMYKTTDFVWSKGPFRVTEVKDDCVRAEYCGDDPADKRKSMATTTSFHRFNDGECYQVDEPKKIPEVYYDPEDESINVVTDEDDHVGMYNVDESNVQDNWTKLQPKTK